MRVCCGDRDDVGDVSWLLSDALLVDFVSFLASSDLPPTPLPSKPSPDPASPKFASDSHITPLTKHCNNVPSFIPYPLHNRAFQQE